MSIKLSYWLGKKKVTLREYCLHHNIKSYEDLKHKCKEYNLIPVDLFKFNNVLPGLVGKKDTTKIKRTKINETKKARTTKKRKTSKKLEEWQSRCNY